MADVFIQCLVSSLDEQTLMVHHTSALVTFSILIHKSSSITVITQIFYLKSIVQTFIQFVHSKPWLRSLQTFLVHPSWLQSLSFTPCVLSLAPCLQQTPPFLAILVLYVCNIHLPEQLDWHSLLDCRVYDEVCSLPCPSWCMHLLPRQLPKTTIDTASSSMVRCSSYYDSNIIHLHYRLDCTLPRNTIE